MPKQIVNISDTIKLFQEKFNITSADVGWRGNLLTTEDSDIVGAINELKLQTDLIDSNASGSIAKIGTIGDLETPVTTDLVAAINSVYELVDSAYDFRSKISVTDAGGDGSLAYNNTTGVLTYTGPSASEVRAHFSAGDAISISAGVVSVPDDGITYAKIQNVTATDRLLGRDTAGAGIIEELAPAAVRTMLNIADGANNYSHPNHTGDVTSVGDGATTIANDAVTYAKMQNVVTANRLLGSTSAGGVVTELQVATAMVANDAITYAKIQNVATANRLLGSTSAGGEVSELQVATEMLEDSAVSRAKLKDDVELIIYNSSGTAVKTLYGAGS